MRILEKATLNVKHPGSVRGIFDVVRGMATCTSLGAIAGVLNKLGACKDIELVRCKERFFTAPSHGGWRDCLVCFVIKDDVNRHVCELQITHRDMLVARKGLPGHAVYNRVRNASELLEVVLPRTLMPGASVSDVSRMRIEHVRGFPRRECVLCMCISLAGVDADQTGLVPSDLAVTPAVWPRIWGVDALLLQTVHISRWRSLKWGTGCPSFAVSMWQGVTTDTSHAVVALSLSGLELQGPL